MAKASTAAARPSGGNQSHNPSQEMVRNRPAAVASVASAGHSRSQKIVQRARRNAVASADPTDRSAPRWPGASVALSVFSSVSVCEPPPESGLMSRPASPNGE